MGGVLCKYSDIFDVFLYLRRAKLKFAHESLPFADAKTFAFRSFPAKCVAEFYVAHNIEFLVRRKRRRKSVGEVLVLPYSLP